MTSPASSWHSGEPVVVLAQSARALAEAAAAAGHAPWIIDAFGDTDTRACAARLRTVGSGSDGQLDASAVLATVRDWRAAARAPLVWGGNLEAQPDLLGALADHHEVLGTAPAALRTLGDMVEFAATLGRAGIALPDTVSGPQAAGGNWLLKRHGSSGGRHVRPCPPGAWPGAGEYLQRELPGESFSCVFVAHAAGAVPLAWNLLLRLQACSEAPYRYGGAVRLPALPDGLRQRCLHAARTLALDFGWRGLCGFDFVSDGSTMHVVDLNPRPTATFPLAVPLADAFRAHVAACRGAPLPVLSPRTDVAGHLVCYAPAPLLIPPDIAWPAWISDRPPSGTRVPRDAPLCTINASSSRVADTRGRLAVRLRAVLAWARDETFAVPPGGGDDD